MKKAIIHSMIKIPLIKPIILYILDSYNQFLLKDIFNRRAVTIFRGKGSIKKMIIGTDNKIEIKDGAYCNNTIFHIIGNGNKIIIDEHCDIGPDCSFWIEGNMSSIVIGPNTSFTRNCHINAQENKKNIIIGKNCMLSNNIIVRTSDSHPIYTHKNNRRLNYGADVIIDDDVWIAPDSRIMKGVHIGRGSVIGSSSIVTKDVPAYCLAVGVPARVAKEGIYWTREDIRFIQ